MGLVFPHFRQSNRVRGHYSNYWRTAVALECPNRGCFVRLTLRNPGETREAEVLFVPSIERLFESAVPIDCSNRASPCVIASCGCYNYRYVSDTSAAAASTKAGKNSSDRHKRILTVRGKACSRIISADRPRNERASSRKWRGRNGAKFETRGAEKSREILWRIILGILRI